ncbi:MAG TPA: GLUG motif-containing protein [Stellaceae bacterium]
MPPAAARHQTVLPRGGNYVAGSGAISRSGDALTVTQSSLNGIIDWRRFSIGQNGSVVFNNGGGATLNEVTGSAVSGLMGTLTATGSVYLINQNGVLIGNGARINTGGSFVASTLDVDPNAFMAGGALTFSGSSSAGITNRGAVSAGGDVFLIARTVENDGSLVAPNGTVGLAAGSQVLLQDAASDQRIFIQAPGGNVTNTGTIAAAQAELKAAGGNVYALAGNDGGIIAATGTATRAGHVWLTATSGGSVTVSSTITAQNADGGGGKVTIAGDKATGSASLTGTIDVSAKAPGKTGGKATITAATVSLDATAKINATGDAGGGTVEIGGGLHGADASVANAQTTTVAAGAQIDASATGSGNGGTVAVWSNGTTSFNGAILAQGGPTGGDGGMVETSGHYLGVGATAVVSTAAPAGATGTWLLDPVDVNITTNPTDGTETDTGGTFQASNTDTANINNGDIEAALVNNNITITTACGGGTCNGPDGGTITVESGANITWSSGNTLTLNADSNIVLDAAISAPNGGITLNAVGSITTGAGGAVNVGSFILQSGNWSQVSVTLPSFSATNDFEIQGGSFLRALGGNGSSGSPYQLTDIYGVQGIGSSTTLLGANFVLANNIDATGTATWNSGAGFMPIGNTTLFSGGFNGNSYAMNGLTINQPSASSGIGLFNDVDSGATLSDIALTNVSITGNGTVGALTALNNGTISQSYSTGTVAGSGTSIGGLVGANLGSIAQSYSTAAVTGSNTVGGLVGTNQGSIIQAYAVGTVSGSSNIGGLVGNNASGTITQAYAVGAVSGGSNIGGLVGNNVFGTITQSYATGMVTGGSGSSDVGGLTGQNNGAITQSYSIGVVSAGSGSSDVGGLVGNNVGSVSADSFWDTESSGQSVGVGFNAPNIGAVFSAQGLTTAQAQSQSYLTTTLGWSFGTPSTTNPWAIVDGVFYPYLAWRYPNGIEVVAGTAPTAGATVNLLGNGASLGSITAGASGYYYFLFDPGTIPTGDALMTYLPSGTAANAVSALDPVAGSDGTTSYVATNLTLTANTITLTGSSGTVATSQLATALGGNSGAAFLYSAAGNTITPGSSSVTLDITAGSANIAIDDAIDTSGALTLDTTGNISAPSAVLAGVFTLQSGAWSQLGASLPSFSATDFRLAGGSFLRALGGDGDSTATAYQITDVYGLQGIGSATLLADDFILANTIDATGTASWNSNTGFAPIGSTTAFTGSLNGAGDTIDALTIKQPTGSNIGLFGVIGSGGSVSNLGLTSVAITGHDNVGALVGNNRGTISQGFVTGTVSVTSSATINNIVPQNIGGLIGDNSGTVMQSYGTATVTTAKNSQYVGGLVGDDETGSVIQQSYDAGNVTAGNLFYAVGGLVGYNDGTITQSYVTAAVTVTGTNGTQWLGGLAGWSDTDGIITNSYSNATVKAATGGSLIMVGGLTGENDGTISASYSTGNVTGPDFVGGLVGQNGGTITLSYSTGAVSAAGSTGVGGLVGTNTSAASIAQSYATGTVINTAARRVGWSATTRAAALRSRSPTRPALSATPPPAPAISAGWSAPMGAAQRSPRPTRRARSAPPTAQPPSSAGWPG